MRLPPGPTAVTFEAVKFQGIAVGKSTKHELITAWGQPADTSATPEGDVLVYRKSPFQAVEVLVGKNGLVSTIKITLAAPIEYKKLSEQLSLDRIDPVTISDDADKSVGLAFPERGVMFMFTNSENVTPVDEDKSAAAAPTTVSHVVIQQLDSHAFALRAEKHLHGPYAQNISDLKTAIALEPEFANAYCLLAKIYLATGQADLADAAAAEACDIEPKNASYQLLRAQTRELLGEYDDAVLKVRAVLDREDLTALDRAQALHRMARLASLGDGEIASKTISFETRAIEVADKLATSKDAKERRAAKQLLVEAHIAIAEEVARQSYNQKVETLSQWVGRASGLAEDYIAKDGGSVELRLIIAQRVLASLASFRPTLDPAPWVAEAEEAAKTLFAQSDDEMWQQHVKWELGIAYLNALRVEHTRRQTEMALKYGQEAIDNLAVGASGRQAVHSLGTIGRPTLFPNGRRLRRPQVGSCESRSMVRQSRAAPDRPAPRLGAVRSAPRRRNARQHGRELLAAGQPNPRPRPDANRRRPRRSGRRKRRPRQNDARRAVRQPLHHVSTNGRGDERGQVLRPGQVGRGAGDEAVATRRPHEEQQEPFTIKAAAAAHRSRHTSCAVVLALRTVPTHIVATARQTLHRHLCQ